MKLKICWRSQEGDRAKYVEHLLKKAMNNELNEPEKGHESCKCQGSRNDMSKPDVIYIVTCRDLDMKCGTVRFNVGCTELYFLSGIFIPFYTFLLFGGNIWEYFFCAELY